MLKLDESRNYATAFHEALKEVPTTLVPEKLIEMSESKRLKKMQIILKIADLKILKNLSLHLEAIQ